MDNNNQPIQPTAQPTLATVQAGQEKESSKMVLWFIGGIVLIMLAVGGIYWFLSKQQINQQVSQVPVRPAEAQVTTETLSQNLNAVDVEYSDSSDFSQVDQDLQDL